MGMALDAELEKLGPDKDDLEQRKNRLLLRPSDTFDKWAHVASLQLAFRLAAVAYVGIWLFLYWLDPVGMKGLSHYVQQHVIGHLSVNEAVYGRALFSALSAALLGSIVFFVRHHQLQNSADAVMKDAQQGL
jgi:hypothetical protein